MNAKDPLPCDCKVCQRPVAATLRLAAEYPREFAEWLDMLARCYDSNHPDYPEEGGKGITVCEEYVGSFAAFMRDMGPMPSE